MKYLFLSVFLLAAVPCHADTLLLQDGSRLECDVTGEMEDTLLVRTKYGSLTVKKEDIKERIAPTPAAEAAPHAGAPEQPTSHAVQPSTAAPAQVPSVAPQAVAAPAARLAFTTIQDGTSTIRLVYFKDGISIATETRTADGKFLALEGSIPNGKYTETYPSGGLRTVKTMLAGRANGPLKAYYPSGKPQAEAYYLAGVKEGPFRYFTEEGPLLLEASYSGDRLNGWKKEFGPDGAVLSDVYYVNDKPGEPPSAKPAAQQPAAKTAEKAAPAEPQSLVTAKAKRLARGYRFSFSLNDKYVGRVQLDRNFNIMRIRAGKIPDGTVKLFSGDGRLEKEFVFQDHDLKLLRVYDDAGKPTEYSYIKDKAIKK